MQSAPAIYRLAAVDVIRSATKLSHVARHVALPPPPARGAPRLPGGAEAPPVLIFNLQLPAYPAPFWAPGDGPGESVVYYYALRDEFDPAVFPNQAALALLSRFVAGGREADGSPSRDRLKLIGRVCNVGEWAEAAPLGVAERRLLESYNETPVLMRPQVRRGAACGRQPAGARSRARGGASASPHGAHPTGEGSLRAKQRASRLALAAT